MIRHVVLFTFTDDFDPAEWLDGVQGLPQKIPQIKHLSIGPNVGHNSTSCDFVLIADFDDLDAVKEYVDHPDHAAIGQMSSSNAVSIYSADLEI